MEKRNENALFKSRSILCPSVFPISAVHKVILVAGGSNGIDYDYGDGVDYGDSVEILSHEFALAKRKLAKLLKVILESPSLILSGDTLLICGGYNNENKCLKHENDSWIEHSTLNNNRTIASAVTTSEGT